MSDKIKRAQLLAEFIHMGQKRQDGEPYINHPKRMVLSYIKTITESPHLIWEDIDYGLLKLTLEQEDIICAIWLHDVKEDDPHQGVAMLALCTYFEGRVDELVDILTHRGYESYNEYIERVAANPEALQIKWLDMWDNCSYNIPPGQKLKYKNACLFLQSKGVSVPNRLIERLEIK